MRRYRARRAIAGAPRDIAIKKSADARSLYPAVAAHRELEADQGEADGRRGAAGTFFSALQGSEARDYELDVSGGHLVAKDKLSIFKKLATMTPRRMRNGTRK
jgi:hypothetical protein